MENCKRARPCYLAVWWERHTQLFIYILPTEVGKNPAATTPQIYWLIPHSSAIVATSVSEDTKLLAVGQAGGVVSIYNLQSELCERVTMVAKNPDHISCMEWFDSAIGVGTQEGQLMAMATGEHRDEPPFSLGQRYFYNLALNRFGCLCTPPPTHTHIHMYVMSYRVKKQMETHSSLFQSSGYEIDSKVVGLRVNSAMPSVVRVGQLPSNHVLIRFISFHNS